MVIATLLLTCLADPIPVLFLGNSHTWSNDLPGMVRQLAESDGSNRKVITETLQSEFLEGFATSASAASKIKSRRWSTIVLQGLKLSSSHKYLYDHQGAETIAGVAKENADKALLFAEWPRKGWDETEWIIDQYRETSKVSKVPICPVGRAWAPVLQEFPSLALWSQDGNHASVAGTYLAACGLYYSVFGDDRDPKWHPQGLKESVAKRLQKHAHNAVK